MATAVKDKDIDSLKKMDTGRGSCPRCGKHSTKGFVKIDVVKYGEVKSAKGSKHIKGKSRSLCGKCMVEVFKSLNRRFDQELNR